MSLTAKRVNKLVRCGEPGKHFDRDGLYLIIAGKAAAHWELRYQLHGRGRWMGLGGAKNFTLEEARARARRQRQLLADGADPIALRRAERAAQAAAAAKVLTFGECAQLYFNAHAPSWKSHQHVLQWQRSVLGRTPTGVSKQGDHCKILRPMPVASIDTARVLRVLEPLWTERTETAARVRARIEAVLDWAGVRGHRTGDNPARWKGHLAEVLPSRAKIKKREHFAAVPYKEMPGFMAALRRRQGVAPRALEFLVHCAARTGEVIGAPWSEIDFDAALWTVPAERMKAHRQHRVPLSDQAIELLRRLPREEGNDHVFIGVQPGRGLGVNSLVRLMGQMGRSETVHGLRSSFSDWAHETTAHANHTIEISLAHSVGAAAEKAYRHGDLLDKRRTLMKQWATYLNSPQQHGSADIVGIRERELVS